MTISDVLSLCGGLGMFLFGMHMMSDGLEAAAGEKMKKVLENNWDLVILDMSLPTYNITSTESGGDKKPVAGKNIMKRMLNKQIFSPVVVITQFETFDDDKISLESLNKEFETSFSQIWKGTIYYGDDEWASNFENLLDTLDL